MKPPRTEDELLARAERIAGRTLGELAEACGEAVPDDLARAKGFVGRLIESVLGATAGNRPAPDFEELGVELKTLPIGRDKTPRETTYVCRVPLSDIEEITWEDSRVKKKLDSVLWVPVVAAPEVRVAERRVGQALLWRLEGPYAEALRRDWEEHVETIRLGFIDGVSASDGRYLQIRPKAADASQKTWAPGKDGGQVLSLPRGYYLRREFTAQILRRHYAF